MKTLVNDYYALVQLDAFYVCAIRSNVCSKELLFYALSSADLAIWRE